MFYKPTLDRSVERYKSLWNRDAPDRVLVKIDIQDPSTPTVLNALAYAPDFSKVVDEWEKGFVINKEINDDNLPIVYGDLGAYIFGGFLGASVTWGTGGAYSEKLIPDMQNYRDYMHFDSNNSYYKLQLDYLRYLKERSREKFGFTEMLPIDGMNFLDCVRGGPAYTDVYDYPEEVEKLLDFASDVNVQFVHDQRKITETYKGGRFSPYAIWTPGETVFISVDAYGQCGPEVFERHGRKYVQRLIDEFNGGWLHVHSDAMRLLPEYVRLKGLVAIGLEDWIKPPRALDHLDTIVETTGDIPLMINITRDELLAKIEDRTLRGNILYWVSGIRTTQEANRVAGIAHNYRAKTVQRIF
jgi:hypothetical protein